MANERKKHAMACHTQQSIQVRQLALALTGPIIPSEITKGDTRSMARILKTEACTSVCPSSNGSLSLTHKQNSSAAAEG